MPRKNDSLEIRDAGRDLLTIKRVTIATLVIIAVAGALFAYLSWTFSAAQQQFMEAQKKMDNYIARHKAGVSKLFNTEEYLTFENLDFGLRSELSKPSAPQEVKYELDVTVRVNPCRTVAEFEERGKELKEEIDKILIDPPLSAKVRLILRGERIYE